MAEEEKDMKAIYQLLVGVIGGIVLTCLVGVNSTVGPLLAALGGVCAIVWGSDAIRRVAQYGLGTGVPSIGYMSLGAGVVCSLTGLALAAMVGSAYLGPVIGLVLGLICGCIIAIVATKIIGMKIPIMVRCTTELVGAATLSVTAFSVAIAGSLSFNTILTTVVATGFIALLFILNTMAVQHPYNACLGPNEDRHRTFLCTLSCAFMSVIIVGFCAIPAGGYAWLLIIIVGLIGWLISFKKYMQAAYEGAASVKWSGLWPKVEL